LKTYGGGDILHTFLALALDGGEWSALCPGCCTFGKEIPVLTLWIGGWSRHGGKEKKSLPLPEIKTMLSSL